MKTLKQKLKYLIPLIILFLSFENVSSQNCTVNAGTPKTICLSQGLALDGGQENNVLVDAVWSQTGGPSVTITNPNNLKSTITGYQAGQIYTFTITATCEDGNVVSQDVAFTVNPITIANAGNNIASCPKDGIALSANDAAGVEETGKWTIVGVPKDDNKAGVTITDENLATTTIDLSPTSAGTTTLRWEITNPNGCKSHDDIVITNYGGVSTITAGDDIELDGCYTVAQSHKLSASFGGNDINGQNGTWSFVSGPSTPSFDNINSNTATVSDLKEGTYVFRWKVVGLCASGTDEVEIKVLAPSQEVTKVLNDKGKGQIKDIRLCNENITKIVLTGITPKFAGETILWELTSDQTGVSIVNSDEVSTEITGLDATTNKPYVFKYKITNDKSKCFNFDDEIKIYYSTKTPKISVGDDQVLDCNDTKATIPIVREGGSLGRYKIVSGPVVSEKWITSKLGGTTDKDYDITFSKAGIYSLLFEQYAIGYECENAFDEITIIVSKNVSASNAGTDQELPCDNVAASLIGNDPDNGEGFWTQVSGPNIATIADVNKENSGISNLVKGLYVFRWLISSSAKCPTSEDDVTVKVSTTPVTQAEPGDPKTICHSSELILEGNTPDDNETGTWSVSPSTGVKFSNKNSPKAVVSGLSKASTDYTFTWKISSICGTTTNDVVITTSTTAGASKAQAGDDQCLASGTTSVKMDATNPNTGDGFWTILSKPDGNDPSITNTESNETEITGMVNGVYKLEWKVESGTCQVNRDTVVIAISGDVTTAAAGDDKNVCGTSVAMTADPATVGTGEWVRVSGNAGYSISDVNSPTATFSDLSPGMYEFSWNISQLGCESSSEDNVKINVSAAPSTAEAGTISDICGDNKVTLDATEPTSGTGFWSVTYPSSIATNSTVPNAPTFDDIKKHNANVTNLATGIYTFRWNVVTGAFCTPSIDDVVIKVSAKATAGKDQNLCSSNTILLEGTDGTNGTWTETSTHGDATITKNTEYTAIVTGMTAPKEYIFKYVAPAIFTCPETDDEVTINTSPYGSTPSAGEDQKICTTSGNSVSMDATKPVDGKGTGTWILMSKPSGAPDPVISKTTYNSDVTNLKDGLYVYEWNVNYLQCPTYKDVVRIEVSEPPTVAEAGDEQTDVCRTYANLVGNTPTKGIGTWTQVIVDTESEGTIESPNQPKTKVAVSDIGLHRFKWTITNGSCDESADEVDVTFIGSPTKPNAGSKQKLCDKSEITMAGNDVTKGEWTKVSGGDATITDDASHTTTVTGMTAGEYRFRWASITGNCSLIDDVIISISPLPVTSAAGENKNICEFDPVSLNANDPSPNSGEWSQEGGLTTIITSVDNHVTPVNGATVGSGYTYKWTISSGHCDPSTDEVTLSIIARPDKTLTVNGSTVCDKIHGTITIVSAKDKVTYKAYIGETEIASGIGDGSDLVLTIPHENLSVGDNLLTIKADNGTCMEYLTNQPTIVVNENPDLALTVQGSTVCIDFDGTVTIKSAENGITYKAFKGEDELVSIKATADANLDLTIPSAKLTVGNNAITFKAANANCEATMENTTTVIVKNKPKIDLEVKGSYTCTGVNGSVTITSAENGITYKAFKGTTELATGTGTGGDLILTIAIGNLDAGENTITIKADNGTCAEVTLTNTAIVTVKGDIASDLAVEGSTVCSTTDGTITIKSSEEGVTYKTYNVSNEELTTGDVGTGANLVITIPKDKLIVGSIEITIKAHLGGDCSIVTLENKATITVKESPSIGLVIEGSDICFGSSGTVVIKSAQNNVTYTAFIGTTQLVSGTGKGTDLSLTIGNSSLIVGENTVIIKASNGTCELELTAKATINQKASINLSLIVSADNSSICSGSSANILIENTEVGVKYQLRNDLDDSNIGTAIDGDGSTISLPTGNITVTTTFNVTGTIEGCTPQELTNKVTVTILTKPNTGLAINADETTVCIDNATNIIVNNSETDVTYQLRNDSDNSNVGASQVGNGSSLLLPTDNISANTTFNVLATRGSCESAVMDTKVTIQVNLCNKPPIAVDDSRVITEFTLLNVKVYENDSDPDGDLDNSSVIIISNPKYGTATLDGTGGIDYTPNFEFKDEDRITYRIYDKTGLYDEADVIITGCPVFAPEGFSPNGDQINDIYKIIGVDCSPVEIVIFNRWGNRVYESKNYQNDWDGSADNNIKTGNSKLPAGTYFYILYKNGVKIKNGHLYLSY